MSYFLIKQKFRFVAHTAVLIQFTFADAPFLFRISYPGLRRPSLPGVI